MIMFYCFFYQEMLEQLKGIDVGFLSSIAKMIASCRYSGPPTDQSDSWPTLPYNTLQYLTIPTLPYYSCNKYCDLIGHSEA